MSADSLFQPLSEEKFNNFFADIGATCESVKKDVETLKEWIRKQPHLPIIEDDEWLISFLLGCKNSLERAKARIDNYYIMKTSMPEVFQNRDPNNEEMELTFRYGTFIPCPKLTPDGYRIAVFHIFDKSDNHVPSGENMMKMIQINLDIFLKLDRSRALILIYNLENCTPAYVRIIIPVLKKFTTLTTKITPRRQRKVYILNFASYLDIVFKFLKTFISKKMNDRIEMWNDKATNLINVLPKECLPADFGGDQYSLQQLRDIWYEEVKTHRDWLIAGEKETANLNLMPTDTTTHDGNAQYGMNGSFRALRLD